VIEQKNCVKPTSCSELQLVIVVGKISGFRKYLSVVSFRAGQVRTSSSILPSSGALIYLTRTKFIERIFTIPYPSSILEWQ
jgi:hypothetical protein